MKRFATVGVALFLFLSACMASTNKMKVLEPGNLGSSISSEVKQGSNRIKISQEKQSEASVYRSDEYYIEEGKSAVLTEISLAILEHGSKLEVNATTTKSQSKNGKCLSSFDRLEIKGLKNYNIQESINQSLAKLTETAEDNFQAMSSGKHPGHGMLCSDPKTNAIPQLMFLNRCTITYAKKDLLGIKCSEFYTGGAYPLIYVPSITVNLSTGYVYGFSDLFKPNANYRQKLGEILTSAYFLPGVEDNGIIQSFKNLSSQNTFYIGTDCKMHNGQYNKWPVKDSDICLVITNTSWSSGPIRGKKFSIPLKQIEGILSPELLEAMEPLS
jgi:hypothetical protein